MREIRREGEKEGREDTEVSSLVTDIIIKRMLTITFSIVRSNGTYNTKF